MWVEQLLLKFNDLNLKFGHTTHQGLFYIGGYDYQGMLVIEEHESIEKCAREIYMHALKSQIKEETAYVGRTTR